ncbi:STAS/SEC14 domain-containing protein [Actinomycetospora lutea]|uniref:STAS/SEC14 domain-containing protein n=1 Tax=Actinomycetospora lutea TaxID=663604 RepID=UPI00236666D8|nr:STAS/SEC14 domain-containing protein [Actinomycetospora lutea]MDD7939567.1 STAS/SEC14 domain-containing protein [Actinomycetospora lutea]
MIEELTDLPPEIDGVRAGGVLTRDEYDAVVLPLLQEAERTDRTMRVLCRIEDDYTGVTPAALWEDLRLGLRALRRFAAFAVVTDLAWMRTACRLAAWTTPYPLRVFTTAERDDAVAWLLAVHEGPRIRTRTDLGRGVVVVEADRALRTDDIDALTAAVEEELRTARELRGLVVHAPGIPGWANLPALWHHLGFVAGHQHRIRRLALAIDGVLPAAGATLADAALHPQVRHFPHDDLDAAVDWAGEDGVPIGAAGATGTVRGTRPASPSDES